MFVRKMTVFYVVAGLFLIISTSLVTMESSCNKHMNCEECILDSSGCTWCAQHNLNTTRCKLRSETISWCDGHLIDPKSSQNTTENLNYNEKADNIIQLKPQQAILNMRVGDSIDVDFGFKAVSGYPIDLYFLLDVSQSMNIVIKTTIKQVKDMYKTMHTFTNDVRMGFGSFVDKNAFPFTYKINSTLTYSFKHQLKFTSDYETFVERISYTPLGENIDDPEGGFDALSQVIACKNEIGWRKESRKIIIFLTDAAFHAAGDGKWAGIVKPYDGKCYMNKDGTYSKELELDYPSVSIISKMAREEEITIIFAVKGETELQKAYMGLKKAISGSIYVRSDQFEKHMAEELKKQYEEISRKIKLRKSISPGLRDYISIEFNNSENYYNYSKLEEVKFKSKITLKSLPDSKIKDMNLNISVEGIDERFMVKINVLSQCDCQAEQNSSECHKGGNLRCGMCECNADRYGNNCQCEMNSLRNRNAFDNSSCILSGTNEICSGRGKCSCGMCQCSKSYGGKNCECDNESCRRDDQGKLCGGHGNCVCGICKCDVDWSGQICDCPSSNEKCYADDPEILCSNLGKCTCNTCHCDPPAEWDARVRQNSICDMFPCSLCHSAQCQKLDACVNCHFLQRNSTDRQNLCKNKCYGLTNIPTQYAESMNDTIGNVSDTWNVCTDTRISPGCYITFAYQYSKGEYGFKILIETVENCAESYYYLGATCLVSIILVGLLTALVWKIRCEYLDRKEYSTFIKNLDSNMREFVNPLHVSAETTYNNPMYRGDQPKTDKPREVKNKTKIET